MATEFASYNRPAFYPTMSYVNSPACGAIRNESIISSIDIHDESVKERLSEASTIQPSHTKHEVGWRHIIRNFSPS